MSAFTTTSERSRQLDLFPISDSSPTSSSAAHRARTFPAPTPKAKGSRANAPASTSKLSVWSEIAALAGSLLRTAVTSELVALTGCSMRWKRSATPANRAWWVLTISAPTMSASGRGSSASIPSNSLGLVGTPIRKIGRRSSEFVADRSPTMVEALHQTLPTPMATDGMRDGAGGGVGSTYPLRMILTTPR